eukprot:367372_1
MSLTWFFISLFMFRSYAADQRKKATDDSEIYKSVGVIVAMSPHPFTIGIPSSQMSLRSTLVELATEYKFTKFPISQGTGTIVSQKNIITAAHLFFNEGSGDLEPKHDPQRVEIRFYPGMNHKFWRVSASSTTKLKNIAQNLMENDGDKSIYPYFIITAVRKCSNYNNGLLGTTCSIAPSSRYGSDYALATISEEFDKKRIIPFGFNKFLKQTVGTTKGSELVTFGYPGDKEKYLLYKSPFIVDELVELDVTSCSYNKVTEHDITDRGAGEAMVCSECVGSDGQSGSPILQLKPVQINGIFVEGECAQHDRNGNKICTPIRGVRITRNVIAEVCAWMEQDGVLEDQFVCKWWAERRSRGMKVHPLLYVDYNYDAYAVLLLVLVLMMFGIVILISGIIGAVFGYFVASISWENLTQKKKKKVKNKKNNNHEQYNI